MAAPAIGQKRPLLTTDINLENIRYPFKVHYLPLHIQRQSLQMAYMYVRPNAGNGRTVLLLHGKNFCSAYWERTAADLLNAGYSVLMPDQIGFGKSSKPKQFQYSFPLLAANTKALMDELHIRKVAVLGHSMGGMLAARFTLMYPERVEQLILEDPLGLEDWRLKVPYQSVDDWYDDELEQDYASIKAYQKKNYYGNSWHPEYDRWARIQAGWTKNPDYPLIAWNAALTSDMIFTQPVCYEWNQIAVPTLLIIGRRDRTAIGKDKVPPAIAATMGDYPKLARQVQRRIPDAELEELPDTGHLPHIEAYDLFISPLLGFLSEKQEKERNFGCK